VQVGGSGDGEFHGAADVRAVLASNPYETDLAASRLAAHIRGDLPGSNRVYDIVKAGAVPVMVSNDVDVTLYGNFDIIGGHHWGTSLRAFPSSDPPRSRRVLRSTSAPLLVGC